MPIAGCFSEMLVDYRSYFYIIEESYMQEPDRKKTIPNPSLGSKDVLMVLTEGSCYRTIYNGIGR